MNLHSKKRLFVAMLSIALVGCDGYRYQGRDGAENRAIADTMPLDEAYSFYVETYAGTSPPMLDVAGTFERFGSEGSDYLVGKALETNSGKEFEAVGVALLLLDYSCPPSVGAALNRKRGQLNAEFDVTLICDQS
jgi:hypothetical protein